MIRQFFAYVLFCIMAAHASAAQAQNRGTDIVQGNNIVIEKKDGKFTGAITAHTSSTYPGLISDLELRFVWSGIFDQPTEYYQFIWNKSGSITYAGATFMRDQLYKYPDLQRRFDDLRPGNIKLSMDIVIGGGINLNCAQGYQSNVGCITSFSKVVTEIPHLMIAASGKVGDNITPTSPVDNWVGFFETRHLSGDPKEINRKLHDMMRRADTVRVRNLRLVSYAVPTTMVSGIIEEFYKREEEEAEKELEQKITTDTEDEKSLLDKAVDFFSDDEDERDDFWSGGSESASKATSDDDFWSGEDVAIPAKPSTRNNTNSPVTSDEQVIIEKNGVKTTSGKVLIPYRDWLVRSFKDGVASVSIIEKSPDLSIGDCGKITGYRSTTGPVNSRGEWIEPPFKKVFVKKDSRTPKYIFEQVKGMGYSDHKAALKTWRDSCKPKLDRAAREFESRFN